MPQNILYISRSQKNKEKIKKTNAYFLHYFPMPHAEKRTPLSLYKYIEKTKAYIAQHKIDAIFYSSDINSLIASALCEELNFTGPSFESTFLCYHKFYTRKATNSLKTTAVTIEEIPQINHPFPFYLKDPCSALGHLGFYIEKKEDLKKAYLLCKEYLPKQKENDLALFENHLDFKKYPLAKEPIMMIEPLILKAQLTIEGFVYNNEVYFTFTTDTHFFPNTRIFEHFSTPSSIEKTLEEKIKKKTEEYIKKINLNHSFFNAEFWIDEDPVLIELNARAAACFKNLYLKSYGYDVIDAGCQLALGKKPSLPSLSSQISGQFNIMISKTTHTSQIYCFDDKKELPFKIRMMRKQNTLAEVKGDNGLAVAQIEICGKNHQEISKLAEEYRKKYFKNILFKRTS